MHAISSYRGNRPTNTHTHKPTDGTDYNTLRRMQCSKLDKDDYTEAVLLTLVRLVFLVAALTAAQARGVVWSAEAVPS